MTDFDSKQAVAEGWDIFDTGSGGVSSYQLQKCDATDKFATDDAAWRHVVELAYHGSDYHRVALAWLKTNAPDEFKAIESQHVGFMPTIA